MIVIRTAATRTDLASMTSKGCRLADDSRSGRRNLPGFNSSSKVYVKQSTSIALLLTTAKCCLKNR